MNDQNPIPNPSTPPPGNLDGREQARASRSVRPKGEPSKVNRRDFLKIAGVTTVVVLAGAGGFSVMKTLTQGQVEAVKAAIAQILVRRYGEAKGKMLYQKVQQELEVTLAELPYIGTPEENK